jgi:unsaturated chondroitin disaccharide hydrolase
MYTSFGKLWHLAKDATARDYLVTTADSLCTRFSPLIGCLRSWNSPAPTFEVIADNLMNLELLWWAAAETGNGTYSAIARSHANKMMRDLFQPFNPGCAWHLVTYNQDTGALLNRSSTPQGLGLNTVWSRGQAWSVNGFTIAYRYTRDAAYLAQARAAADCFIRLLTACCGNSQYNWAPLWDFNVTAPHISVDTSAMMVAAEAIVELSWYVAGAEGKAYYDFAAQLLAAAEEHWLFAGSENDAVLRNGTVTYPNAGISIVYADYYLLAAKMKFDATPPPM